MSEDLSSGVLFAFCTYLPEPAWMDNGLSLKLHDFGSTLRRIQRIG
jgi:hypothetical protein